MNDLKGIVIDAGHGGTDPGASGNGIIEKDMTLNISNYMYDRFRELGLPVKMTRTTDETLSPSVRVNRVLDAYGNDSDVLVISNHINAGGGEGAEVIYALRNDDELANLVLDEIESEGQLIRKAFQRRLPSNPSQDYYFMLRNTGITEPIIVEYGFLDTAADATRLKNNYIEYAEAVVRAILEYIGYTDDEDNTYTVKAGDSLYSIARKYDVSVEELKAANNLSNNLLNIGMKLKIPTIEKQPQIGEYKVYTVKSGDSLYSIARSNNVSVDELIQYNNLASTNLSIGQKILIPTQKSEDYDTYIVKSGDSLYAIANQYNTDVNTIKEINNLSNNALSIGQRLLIPKQTVENNQIIGNTYTVKSGDTLYTIAQRFNTSVDAIKQSNGLSANILSIGQVLKIPSSTSEITYVVKSGDSLYSIANKYNTTVDVIKQKNNLTSNLLSIGQMLII